MKIQNITQQQLNNNQKNNQPQFKGLGDLAVQGLRFLDTNQAWGATAVDFTCMVAPRTLTDFSRGADAGVETLRREASGTVNHALIGLGYGAFAGWAMSFALNNKYGIQAQRVFADADTVDILGKHRFDVLKSENQAIDYARKVADSISDINGKKFLSEEGKTQFVNTLVNDINNPNADKKTVKAAKEMLNNILHSEGLVEEGKISIKSTDKKVVSAVGDAIDSVTSLSKTLFKEKVVESLRKVDNFADANFIKSIKNFGMRRSLLGLAIGSAIGCSIQPFNIYLTKKKTGSDGFVGVAGREKDNSFGFKALKAGVAAAFGAGVYGCITKGNFKFSNFLKNIQYKGLTPTIPQFMLVYGLTIMSRFMAARDKDELREAAVKDTLGFSSWLLLGPFVAKGVLKGLSKVYKKMNNVDLNILKTTRDEVLHEGLKKAGIATVEEGKALPFKELLKALPKSDKVTKTKLRYLSIAQLAGYAFSGIVLGRGIPLLNIYMTKKSEEKRAREHVMNPANMMYKPENLAFLSKQMNFEINK